MKEMMCKEFLNIVVYVTLVTCYASTSDTTYYPLHPLTVREIYVHCSEKGLFELAPVFLIYVRLTVQIYVQNLWYVLTGEWRKFHNEKLSDLYSLPNILRVVKSRRMRWVGHLARMGEGRTMHRVMVGIPEGKRTLGRTRHRWEDNIKTDVQEVGGDCGDWMELAQDRERLRALASTVMNIRVPKIRGLSWLAAVTS